MSFDISKSESNFNKELGLKIFKARKDKNMSRAALGKVVNLHESTVKRYEDGMIKTLDIEKMKEFAKALDISPEYLMGWGTNIISNNNIDAAKSNNDLIVMCKNHHDTFYDPNKITVYGKVCAGNGLEAFEDPIDEITNPYHRIDKELFALQVHGDSMNNIVNDGMYAIIEKKEEVNNGDIAVVLIDNEIGMLKRFYRLDESTIVLKPDSVNPVHNSMIFENKDINRLKILGRYIGHVSPMLDLI